MKIFKYISLVMVALVVIFFSTGLICSDIDYTNTVVVNASVEKSFEIFNDTSRMKEWMPGFKSITSISGKKNEINSKWKLDIEQEGQHYVMKETVTAFKPNEQFSFFLENAVLTSKTDIYFKKKDNQTEISAVNHVQGNNIFWRSLFYYFKGGLSDNGQKMYDDLKKVIEAS